MELKPPTSSAVRRRALQRVASAPGAVAAASAPGTVAAASSVRVALLAVPALVFAPLPALGPADASAQEDPVSWTTIEQRAAIDLTAGDGSARVAIDFLLGPSDPDAEPPLDRPIELELLGFGDATTDELLVDGRHRRVLWPTVGSHRAATVHPEAIVGPTTEGARTLSLSIAYTIDDVFQAPVSGGPVHVRVPIVTGPPVRAASGVEAFVARLTLPEGWTPTEAFPSGMRADGPAVRVVSLTVAPSVVGFRARTDGRWRPGFPLLVDVLTVLVLGTFAAFGWRHLRTVAS